MEYTAEEVAVHNNPKDCWIIIHGKVYDVTKFLDEHPGGPEIISDNSGGDSTDDFEDTGHSKAAREDMEKYFIGALKGAKIEESNKSAATTTAPKANASATTTKSSQSAGTSPVVFVAVAVALVAAGVAAFLTFNASLADKKKD